MKNRIAASLFACTFIAGCASTSGVLPLGPDTYRVSASRHNMSGGSPAAQSDALTSAQAHCAGLGKEMLVTNTSSSFERPHYSFTATFRCLKQGDPALVRPSYEQAPDVVIQDRRK
jgi:hypothetical protein